MCYTVLVLIEKRMSKILKKIKVPKTDAVIFKRERSRYYNILFYVGLHHSKSGNFQQSLKEENYKKALKLAHKVYKDFWIKNEIKDDEKVVRRTNKFDKIALEFIKLRIKEKGVEGQRELGKWNNCFIHYFGGLDIREMDKVNDALRESILSRQELGNAPQTLIKYQQLISNICKYARKRGLINYEPTLLKLNRLAKEVPPYEPEEIEILSTASRNKDEPFYQDLSDFIQFCRSGLVRPGKEVLRIKHKHIHIVPNVFRDEDGMIVVIGQTKTGKPQNVHIHPMFHKHIYLNRILRRRPNPKPDDYLFFPFLEDRENLEKMRQRVSNNIRILAVKCDLYINKNGLERPMYSLRHSALNQRLESGVSMEFVADKGNTSPEMIKNYYRDVRNQKQMVNDHIKLFPDYYKNK